MRIVVDQDEVLAQFVNKVLKRWNAINLTSYTREDVNCWRMEEILGVDRLGRSAEGLIDEWMREDGFFEKLDPMPGAINGFNALRQQGHDVLVATSIPEVAWNAFDGKRRWMRKHFPDWSMKNFIACSRKGTLAGSSHLLIDDGAHNIKDWAPGFWNRAIVFDAAWNRDVEGDYVYRASNWVEVLEIVSKFNQELETLAQQAEHGVYS